MRRRHYTRREFVKRGSLYVTGVVAFPYIVRAQAADHFYCGPSSTGNGSGSDFNNLLQLPTGTGLTRGKTYVCIEGSYGSRTFSTAASGSTFCNIRAVDPVLDSGVPGYTSALHDSAVIFSDIIVQTPRWAINGVRRTETFRMEAPVGYGIRVTGTIKASSLDSEDASFSQFSYLDCGGTWDEGGTPNCGTVVTQALYFVFNQHDITFTRCVFHNAGASNGGIGMMHGSSDITWDHCDFYMGWGKSTLASPNVECHRWTVKYGRFWNSSRHDTECGTEGGGITCEAGCYGNDLNPSGHLFHNCIFYGTASGGRNAVLDFGGSGFSNSVATNCKAYNNTFAGFPETPVLAHILFSGGSGNEGKNNLCWDASGAFSVTANTASNNVDAVSNPFHDYDNLDFRLAANVAGGTNLGPPYSTDAHGVDIGSNPGALGVAGGDPPPEDGGTVAAKAGNGRARVRAGRFQ